MDLQPSHWAWDAPWSAEASRLTFSPRHPRNLIQFSSVEDMLTNSQTEFWALELDQTVHAENPANDLREVPFALNVAEADGTLRSLASTYSAG